LDSKQQRLLAHRLALALVPRQPEGLKVLSVEVQLLVVGLPLVDSAQLSELLQLLVLLHQYLVRQLALARLLLLLRVAYLAMHRP
jgi:hypothetical protein